MELQPYCRKFSGVVLSLVLAHGSKVAHAEGVTFTEVSELLGPFINGPTSVNAGGASGLQGMVFFDYDNDDDLDMFICGSTGTPNALMENNGDGTFTDVTEVAGLSNLDGCQGVSVGDIDNDGFVDLYLGGDLIDSEGSYLYRNIDGSSFEDITSSSAIRGNGENTLYYYWGNALVDFDNDGYLDIYQGGYPSDRLYRNNRDLTFTDVTEAAGLGGTSYTCGVAFADLDLNGYQDLILSTCSNDPGLVSTVNFNNGDGTFAPTVGFPHHLGFFMGIAVGDIDRDGDFDVFNCDVGTGGYVEVQPHSLLQNDGSGNFEEVISTKGAGIPNEEWGWSASFTDFDNDGDLDLMFAGAGTFGGIYNFGKGRLLFNDGTGAFTEAPQCGPADCTLCGPVVFLGTEETFALQPDTCFADDLCAARDVADGIWFGEQAGFCNELAAGCDGCYRTSACAIGIEDPECVPALGVDLSASASAGLAIGDFDGDGFDDMAIMTSDYSSDYEFFFNTTDYLQSGAITHLVLLKNNGNDNNSIRLRLVGTMSNRNGIGAILTCDDGETKQYLQARSVSGPYAPSQFFPSFGLGQKESADIYVQWPSGLKEAFSGVQPNVLTTLEEGTGIAIEEEEMESVDTSEDASSDSSDNDSNSLNSSAVGHSWRNVMATVLMAALAGYLLK